MTVGVPSTAKVTRNGVAATLADLQVGDHVAVQGVKSGTAYTASKVHVDAPVPVVELPGERLEPWGSGIPAILARVAAAR